MKEVVFDLTDEGAAAFCPSCGAGYTAFVARCADCHDELLPRFEIERMLRATEGDEATQYEEDTPPEEPSSRLPEFDLSDPDAAFFCPDCGSGYRLGPVACVDCNTTLRPRSWVESRTEIESEPREEPVILADVENSFRADVLGAALNDQGVWFVTQPTASSGLRFLVSPRDLDLAREVLSDIDESPEPEPHR